LTKVIPIVLSIGDVNGIGPEVLLKTIALLGTDQRFIITGQYQSVAWWNELLNLKLPLYKMDGTDDVRQIGIGVWSSRQLPEYIPEPGKIRSEAGIIAITAIEDAVDLCRSSIARALVTAPINKESFASGGAQHPGHTEFLAELCGIPENDVVMMLTDESLRVALATIHVPLADVSSLITEERIFGTIERLNRHMMHLYKIEKPRIHVLGLNPHAGDNGVLGDTEIRIILPAIKKAQNAAIDASGPYPADAYFGMRRWEFSDVVLAMYHDQGLIPIKMLSFDKGVNITLGLPFVRTSPDHGTAFDIAGKNIASPSSFMHAVSLVNRLTSH
jgi:4-hydroxythreonine-4-phosphate dehydrogenase